MHFTTLSLSAMSIASVLAQKVHVVTVGGANGTTEYSPNNIVADVGDMVQFQFNPKNHTVTQSTFDQPCQPIQNNSPNVTGFFSGFMGVSASDVIRPAYTIAITSKTPIWVYCSQAKHCQAGMVMVINENTAANATRSLANYAAAAKAAPANLAPGSVSGGNSSSTSSSSSSGSNTTVTTGSPPSSNSGTSSSSSSGSSSGSSGSENSGASSTTEGTAKATTASGAGIVGVSSFVSLVAVAVGLVLF